MRIAFLVFLPCLAVAQQSSTSGPCSPITPNNSGSITITCPGFSREQGDALLRIVNKIFANQLDPNTVMSKLDEISLGIQDIQRRTGDRFITVAQANALAQILRQSPDSVTAVILGDREANTYGRIVFSLLQNSGWRISINQIGMLSPPAYGVQVAGSPSLAAALARVGIPVTEVASVPSARGAPAIIIGLKPY